MQGESKLRKMAKRTITGASLTVVVLAMFLVSWSIGDARPVLVCTGLVLIASVVELDRMGELAGRRLEFLVGLPAMGVLALGWAAVVGPEAVERALDPEAAARGLYRGGVLTEYAAVALLVATLFLLREGAVRLGLRGRIAEGLVAVACAGLFSLLLARPEQAGLLVERAAPFLGGGAVLALILCLTRPGGLARLALAVGLGLWLVVPLPALARIWTEYGARGVASLLILAKVGDVAAYFVGSWLGKTHPLPWLSPGKTTAGFVGSLAAGAAAGIALALVGVLPEGPHGWLGGLAAGLSLNVASQAGDLLESLVKRCARADDASTWLGRSGGVLDVVDSLLLAVPTALVSWPFLFPAGAG